MIITVLIIIALSIPIIIDTNAIKGKWEAYDKGKLYS